MQPSIENFLLAWFAVGTTLAAPALPPAPLRIRLIQG